MVKKDRLLKRLVNIDSKSEEQLKLFKYQGENKSKAIKHQGENQLKAIIRSKLINILCLKSINTQLKGVKRERHYL